MCGRFVSSTPVSVLAERFLAADVRLDEEQAPRFNVAPSDPVVAIAGVGRTRRLRTLSWGLVPSWADTPSPGRRMVNLRSETLVERPGFRRMLQQRRCIVPADGFYEWRASGANGPKQPYLIRSRDGAPLAMAGLWDVWMDRRDAGAERLRTCTVLTTAPNRVMAALHDRMPVVLPPQAWDRWLDPSVTDVDALSALLRPCADELLEVVPVGPAVNSVRNDGPELVESVEPAVRMVPMWDESPPLP
ncbi:MAG TPA: SOS response-associated peptidase [Acidimicrobiales bacterium]|nr:SOS response-associated peptidase [Acidimicrobiales bacterium]